MRVETRECRPDHEAASPKQTHNVQPQSSAIADLPLLARRADHALLVTSGLRTGGVRRHVYFNLPSAQKAVQRAESRGVPASVRLVRLVPAEVLDTTTVPSSVVDLLGSEVV